MLKILINSYTCCPGMGSEQGMGWNWITQLARYCECYVITEGEYKDEVENFIKEKVQELKGSNLPADAPERFAERMHFYYNPIGGRDKEKCEKIRKMCWNQGDWRFYYYYWRWQRRTAELAMKVIKDVEAAGGGKIDVLHQLNMIGFREPGCLGDVSHYTGIPLVWGPIGGLKRFPMAYVKEWKMKSFVKFKNVMNVVQMKYYPRVSRMMRNADVLISSILDSYDAIYKWYGRESEIIPETGCFPKQSEDAPQMVDAKGRIGHRSQWVQGVTDTEHYAERFKGDSLDVIWVGKFDFRKRLDIAIEAVKLANETLASVGQPLINLRVYGSGNAKNVAEAVELAKEHDNIRFMGQAPQSEIVEQMAKSDVFLFTSVSEDTSTVVLEAVSNALPVVCFNACGMAAVITQYDEKVKNNYKGPHGVGMKVEFSNPNKSISDFAEILVDLHYHREKLVAMSANCAARAEELSWENKAKRMVEIYKKINRPT